MRGHSFCATAGLAAVALRCRQPEAERWSSCSGVGAVRRLPETAPRAPRRRGSALEHSRITPLVTAHSDTEPIGRSPLHTVLLSWLAQLGAPVDVPLWRSRLLLRANSCRYLRGYRDVIRLLVFGLAQARELAGIGYRNPSRSPCVRCATLRSMARTRHRRSSCTWLCAQTEGRQSGTPYARAATDGALGRGDGRGHGAERFRGHTGPSTASAIEVARDRLRTPPSRDERRTDHTAVVVVLEPHGGVTRQQRRHHKEDSQKTTHKHGSRAAPR